MSKSYHASCQPLLRLAGRCTPTSPRCRFQLSRFRFTTRRILDLIANSARFDRCRRRPLYSIGQCAVSLFGCALSSDASSQEMRYEGAIQTRFLGSGRVQIPFCFSSRSLHRTASPQIFCFIILNFFLEHMRNLLSYSRNSVSHLGLFGVGV